MRRLKPFLLASALAALAVASSALACGSHHSPWPSSWESRSSYYPSCYSSRRTLAGAIEMYNLDFNTSVRTLDEDMARRLVDEGYLMSMPTCDTRQDRGVPGLHFALAVDPKDPEGHFSEVFCLDHGFQGAGERTSARDQLGDLEANRHLRDRAHQVPVAALRAKRQDQWRARRDRQDRFRSLLFAVGGAPVSALLSLLD